MILNCADLDCTAILGRLSQETARRLVEAATLDIYPPLIVKLNGGKKFTVNYGNEVLKNGDAYEVLIKGKKFMIPTLKNLWVEMRYGWEMR